MKLLSSPLFRTKSVQHILKEAEEGDGEGEITGLHRALSVKDLTAFGIAALIGAGIFSMVGNAAANAGPAVIVLFLLTAIACGFSALCYAEFASMIPVSGSAYTYAYASFGEVIAWIIGWDLLLEYAIGNIAVAISWSDYFTGLLAGIGLHLPSFVTMDFLSAARGHTLALQNFAAGKDIASLPTAIKEAYDAWELAPRLGPVRFIADVPALLLTLSVSILILIGIKESRNVSNVMVALKLGIIAVVIVVGSLYINPSNWSPFMPNGMTGVMSGVSGVFFAYIGFDAISTTAEECANPQRDLPRGMFYSLAICTVLYVILSLVLTGMVSYKELAVGDPMAFVFARVGVDWLSGIVAFSAVVAIASVFLVFQLGQTRIMMSISRDGLLPRIFGRVHPRFRTPAFATIITGLLVAIPALFLNLTEVTDLASIGTLFAFVLVCGGVLILQNRPNPPERKFKIPYVNGRFLVPGGFIVIGILLLILFPQTMRQFFSLSDAEDPSQSAWHVFRHKIPMILFISTAIVMSVLSFLKNLSLIPVLGMMSCFYLMTELTPTNWWRFFIWLAVGLALYFTYGFRHSRLVRSV